MWFFEKVSEFIEVLLCQVQFSQGQCATRDEKAKHHILFANRGGERGWRDQPELYTKFAKGDGWLARLLFRENVLDLSLGEMAFAHKQFANAWLL